MEFFIKEIRLFDGITFDRYPFSLPFVKHLESFKFKKPVTFFVGENGTGKSTLLEALAVSYGLNPEGGSKNFNFSTKRTHSELHDFIKIIRGSRTPKDTFFLRAESFYNVASQIDESESERIGLLKSYGGKSLHEQSHGESFLALILHRFWGNGLYLLDEPEAALSPQKLLTLIARIAQLVKDNSQFVIATHSPILMAFPNAQIYVLSEEGITLTPYFETSHYQLTKQFLNHPDAVLRHLL